MPVIVANQMGVAILVLAFVIAFGVGHLFGLQEEGPLMMIAGPLTAMFDIAYRLIKKDGRLFVSDRGGSLFFLPVWYFGVFWLALGVAYTIG